MAELARRQHGLITRRQAGDLGISPDVLDRRIAGGRWSRVRNGVYAVGAPVPTWEQSVMAACLAGGPDVWASHRTGARLWTLVQRSGQIEVQVAGHRRVRLAHVAVHRSILFPPIDRTTHLQIPTTSLARTIVDVSANQDVRVVGLWIDDAIRRLGLDLLELRSCVARLAGPGRRDLAAIRGALATRLPGYDPGDSELEVRALRALASAGLPTPVQQHEVRRGDGRIARLDLAYPWAMIAIELDGWSVHGVRGAFDEDRIRHDELTLLGWNVYRFTSAMTDAYLVDTVRAALAGRRSAGAVVDPSPTSRPA